MTAELYTCTYCERLEFRQILVFPKWNRNSGNLTNNLTINRAQFKDPVSHTGTVVACWSLTQVVAVWQV